MRNVATGLIAVLAFTNAVSLSHAGPDHRAHGHTQPETSAAGQPGDPKKPSRIVQISMRESEDGGMSFAPANLSFRKGEQVKFVLRNGGKIEHEFVLDSPAANADHKAEMAQNPAMAHDDLNEKRVEAGTTGEFLWSFTKAGTFEYACLIPGHYEAGMKGIVTVK